MKEISKTLYYYYHDRVLMRVYRALHLTNTDTRAERYQVVVPESTRQALIKVAHDGQAGHLGIKKTYAKLLNHFFSGQGSRKV